MPYHNNFNTKNNLSLLIKQEKNSARIQMMISDSVTTADLPLTFQIIKTFLPSVLTSDCFNDLSLPFHKEIKNTEIGHLFEHILLEYMCQLKIAKGHRSAVFAGKTKWNWEREPMGTFHIHINCKPKDADIFPTALNKTIALMKMILNSKNSLPRQQSLLYHNGLKNGKKLKLKKII